MNPDPDLEILARNLRLLQKIHGYSNAEVARRAGSDIAPGTIGNILRCRNLPGLDKIGKIARVFGLRSYHLLMPDFSPELAESGRLDNLYRAYVIADDKGRYLMDANADYITRKAPLNDPNGENGQTNGSAS